MKNAQFLGWKILNGAKVPVDLRTGAVVSAHDPQYWMAEAEARASLKPGIGLAYAVDVNDPYFFIDLDGCLVGGAWSPLSVEICDKFPGAYVEVSQSGTGLHIIGRAALPVPAHACKNTTLHIELYTSGRFIALTGKGARGDAETDHTAALAALIVDYFPVATLSPDAPDEWTTGPCEGWNGYEDDAELLAAACASKGTANWFGNKATFAEIFEGNQDALARAYPTVTSGQTYDASLADGALASHLAFWTGRDCERTRRLMLFSGLTREKWEREDYLNTTIIKAARLAKDVHKKREPMTDRRAARGSYMTPTEQLTHFNGCTYIIDAHRVHSTQHNGAMLRPDQFRAAFAGHRFLLDTLENKPAKSAWEAFVESQENIPATADGTIFSPRETPGALVNREGLTLLNTYRPIDVDCRPGDVSRFTRHLDLLFPVPRDRAIITAYMAFVVQYPGVRARWCPLIQGVDGNGKTLISQLLAYAVGQRYSFCPNPREIAAKFNSWMDGKLFIYIEDIYAPGERNEVIEALKPMITGDFLDIEAKGQEKLTKEICANFILNSNYKEAVQKREGDRRFAIFYTPHQTLEDVNRDFPGNYFAEMYDWLREGGYAFCTHFLKSYQIPNELNPDKGVNRAPLTSSTEEAISVGRSGAEEEIQEAVDSGSVGFKGGWISSHMLDLMLKGAKLERRLPRNRRRELLEKMGYVTHPGLTDGRTNNSVQPDNNKPVLYVLKGHPSSHLRGVAVANAYSKSQELVTAVTASPFSLAGNV